MSAVQRRTNASGVTTYDQLLTPRGSCVMHGSLLVVGAGSVDLVDLEEEEDDEHDHEGVDAAAAAAPG